MRGAVAYQALFAQICAVLLAFTLAKMLAGTLPVWSFLIAQPVLAIAFSLALKLPYWWLPIQALFVPALAASLSLQFHPGWYFLAFLLTLLFFRSNTQERVPLYLTNPATYQAVLELLPTTPKCKFIDLGSGFSGLLVFLAEHRPDIQFAGVESAPAPFIISRLRSLRLPNLSLHYGSFWHTNLAEYDVVYTFLSPEPMPALWQKIQREMHPGSLLISNSFPVPEVPPFKIIEVEDRRKTKLWLCRVQN